LQADESRGTRRILPGKDMAARSPARWLAPLALVTVAVAVYVVVATSVDQDGSTPAERTTTTSGEQRRAPSRDRAGRRPRTYVVRPGDTLSAVSARTGVPLETLQRLNKGLDSQTLQSGQRIKLRP
jgi:LysM repeat protein